MTPKRKRPKVRYVVTTIHPDGMTTWAVHHVKREPTFNRICGCYTRDEARRVAAALNWHTAHKRGEL